MSEKELRRVIALLLEDAKRLQQIEPNAGTDARIWIAKMALESIDSRNIVLSIDTQKDGIEICATEHNSEGEVWTISMKENLFTFVRKINGELQEAYRPVEQDLAAIYAAAIIQGFEPPSQLKEKDGGFIAHQVHQRDSDSQPQHDHADQDIPPD
ncbi:hypothetical protein [Martelella alba]|uniref:hypothetical protein n=1 Tax=Martelella alba TaxID=2590451 RepID=UPI0014857A93|nr:hypothetical protein [Martelella alba]